MATLENNRWVAADDEFAARIEIPDVQGFFSKSVVVEPGFRALFLENGKSLGEILPGKHTLANVVDRMKFWTQKTATVIIARQQDVRLEMTCPRLMTSEFLEVEIALALTVQVDDVALFFSNLMGSKSSLAVNDIREIVAPLLNQSLAEAVGRLSIQELVAEYQRADIETSVTQALGTSLMRYGLKFGSVQTLTIAHPEYDAQRHRTGQLWLQRQDMEFDQQVAKLEAEKLLAQIEGQEKSDDLEILQQQVAADHMEAGLVVRSRRIGIRKQLRAAALAGQFDRINSEEELQQFLEQRDRERLIRQDEIDALKATLKDTVVDRNSARQHLLRKLDLEQAADLESVRIDFEYQRRWKVRQHEIALADLNQSEQSRQWKAELQKEIEGSEHQRVEAQKQLEHDLKMERESASFHRQDEFEEVLHGQRVGRKKREEAFESASAGHRVALLEIETFNARAIADQDLIRRKGEVEREISRNANLDQLERLRLINEMNLAMHKSQHEMQLEAGRQQAQLEAMKIETASKATVAKIGAIKGASSFEVMAASPEVAAFIADVMKSENSANATVAMASAQTVGMKATSERERELQSQVVDARKEGMDAAIAAYRDFLQSQQTAHQTTMQQFGTTIENVTKNTAPQSPQVFFTGGSPTAVGAPPTPASPNQPQNRIVLCPGCRAENQEADRYCRQCGKSL